VVILIGLLWPSLVINLSHRDGSKRLAVGGDFGHAIDRMDVRSITTKLQERDLGFFDRDLQLALRRFMQYQLIERRGDYSSSLRAIGYLQRIVLVRRFSID